MVKTDYMNYMWLKDKYRYMSITDIADYCETYPSVIATCIYNFKLDTKENLSEYLNFL